MAFIQIVCILTVSKKVMPNRHLVPNNFTTSPSLNRKAPLNSIPLQNKPCTEQKKCVKIREVTTHKKSCDMIIKNTDNMEFYAAYSYLYFLSNFQFFFLQKHFILSSKIHKSYIHTQLKLTTQSLLIYRRADGVRSFSRF